MRTNPTRAAGGVGCEKITPCRKNYTAVLALQVRGGFAVLLWMLPNGYNVPAEAGL
jgi:hypothetical protein